MQTTRDCVSAAPEFSARVQDRHDHLDRRAALSGVHRDWDSTAVVNDLDSTVCLECDFNVVTVPREGFVHRVIHNLIHEVMQTALTR